MKQTGLYRDRQQKGLGIEASGTPQGGGQGGLEGGRTGALMGAAARPRVPTSGSRTRVSSLWQLSQDLQKQLPGTVEGTCQARAGTVGKGAALARSGPTHFPSALSLGGSHTVVTVLTGSVWETEGVQIKDGGAKGNQDDDEGGCRMHTLLRACSETRTGPAGGHGLQEGHRSWSSRSPEVHTKLTGIPQSFQRGKLIYRDLERQSNFF